MVIVDGVVLIVLLVVAAAIGFVVADVRRARSAPAVLAARPGSRARWRAGHRTDGDDTVVHVELGEPADGSAVIERRDVGRVANADPDYDRRLDSLMDQARQRAVLLDLNRE